MAQKFGNRVWIAIVSGTVAAVLLALAIYQWSGSAPTWYGYVVGEDRRIYMVNLTTGELEWTSREIEQVREPVVIDINREESILYIANNRTEFGRWDQEPLITPLFAVRLNEAADIVFEVPKYSQAATDGCIATAVGSGRVRLGPLGKKLYVGFLGANCADDGSKTAVLDPLSGEIIKVYPGKMLVQKIQEFSPDGKMLAGIYPAWSRVAELAPDGTWLRESGLREFPGRVWVRNLETERSTVVELDNNQGLYPPWGSPESHFTYLRNQPDQNIYRIDVFDRESGELLAMNDDISGRFYQRHFTRIPGSDNVVVSTNRGIQIYNGLTAEFVKGIYVGTTALTDVVVTDKPLLN